jgi:hypothetical protein
MPEGRGFGETSLAADHAKHRLAYVHTLKPTYFLVIDQVAYRQMRRNHEMRLQK